MSLLRASLAVIAVAAVGGGALAWQAQQHRHELDDRAVMLTGGNPARGRLLFTAYGCNGCHSLRGATQAAARVGPPLDGVGSRAMLAGHVANRPENVVAWIINPQGISPGTAMPNVAVKPADARDLAAYLYARGSE